MMKTVPSPIPNDLGQPCVANHRPASANNAGYLQALNILPKTEMIGKSLTGSIQRRQLWSTVKKVLSGISLTLTVRLDLLIFILPTSY